MAAGMQYLVVGLGNPGGEYARSRHNIGFRALDYYASQHGGSFISCRHGEMARVGVRGRSVALLKPNTYMNESGKAVRYWLTMGRLSTERLLILVDDIALPEGSFRLRASGSAGNHNGLIDIEKKIGTSAYARLRIGVGNDFPRGAQVHYVLEELSDVQLELTDGRFSEIAETIDLFVTQGVERAMNRMNRAHVGASGRGSGASEE